MLKTFRDDLFPTAPEQYSGRVHIETTAKAINDFFEQKYLAISDVIKDSEITWIHNMFTEISAVDSTQTALGRYDGEKIVPLVFWDKNFPYGVKAKNAGQRMLMECLLMDWTKAPLVIVKGGAGTGKTFWLIGSSFARSRVRRHILESLSQLHLKLLVMRD